MPSSDLTILGIRHHGPGSARSVRRALAELQPDVLLVEGPPEADAVLPLLAHPELEPPVALLIYASEMPRRAAFYPLATFSPEYQAIRYALERGIPVRSIDLPLTHAMALEEAKTSDAPDDQEASTLGEEDSALSPEPASLLHPAHDPLGTLAAAAGYSDGERWWEHLVEQRQDGAPVFAAVLEAMAALREGESGPHDEHEARREAWMRRTIRAAEREGFKKIAVVCGAWHAPALATPGNQKADDVLLKGLPKLKTSATIAPWTYGRLTFASGYGAGITSPGWYDHLWQMGERGASTAEVTVRWMAKVAQLLRSEDLDASAAHVIEAVRLAETLAALRERPLPGLPELDEACRAVFCFGGDTPMQLIHERLIVGERLGAVPDEAPTIPLQQDVRREQSRLRLKPEASWRDLELDLRKPNERERSALLRRLNLLGVPWGQIGERSGIGTFKETWRLQWEPAFDVALIEAGIWGTTLTQAASARALDLAQTGSALPDLVAIVNQVLFADLAEAVPPLMQLLQQRSARSGDAGELMDALTREDAQTRSSLTASLRYGSVRQIDTALIEHVIDGLVTRICIGLPFACASLDDDAAETMFKRIMATESAISTLQQAEQRAQWLAALNKVADTSGIHGLVAGRCCRILLDQGMLNAEEVGRRLSLALSSGSDPAAATAWIEGLLRGSGLLLIHDAALWSLIDRWLSELGGDTFQSALPLLRRTFASFAVGERRMLGERATQGERLIGTTDADRSFDPALGEAALATVAMILRDAP
jgi:hypothetical protein